MGGGGRRMLSDRPAVAVVDDSQATGTGTGTGAGAGTGTGTGTGTGAGAGMDTGMGMDMRVAGRGEIQPRPHRRLAGAWNRDPNQVGTSNAGRVVGTL